MKNSYKFSKEDTLSVKAIAIILMLLHHLFTFPEKLKDGATFTNLCTFSDGKTLEYILGDFGKLCVALFMMLSGYGMYCIYRNSKENINNNVIKHIKGLYIKYWQIFFVFVPLGLLLGSNKITHTKFDWITNFFAIRTTFNDETWFLTTYLIMLCLVPIIMRFFDRKGSGILSDIVLLIAFNTLVNTALLSFIRSNQYFTDFSATEFWQKMQIALVMVPMFSMGCYLAKYDIIARVRNSIVSGVAAKFIGVFILVIAFFLRKEWAMRTMWGWDRLDLLYAAAVCIAFALILDGLKYTKIGLAFIGKQATGIWLIHTYLCYYYFQDIMYSPENPILIFLLVFTLSLAISWGISTAGKLIWSQLIKLYGKYSV